MRQNYRKSIIQKPVKFDKKGFPSMLDSGIHGVNLKNNELKEEYFMQNEITVVEESPVKN